MQNFGNQRNCTNLAPTDVFCPFIGDLRFSLTQKLQKMAFSQILTLGLGSKISIQVEFRTKLQYNYQTSLCGGLKNTGFVRLFDFFTQLETY